MLRPHTAFRYDIPVRDGERLVRGGFGISATGSIAMVDGVASIRQAVILLLSTEPGERVMRPTYGCSLEHLIFGPNDDTTAGLIIHYVRRALETWEPRIEILKLDARPSAESPEVMEILLDYRIKTARRSEHLTYRLSLNGERA
jgi:uncharacterized protein